MKEGSNRCKGVCVCVCVCVMFTLSVEKVHRLTSSARFHNN